MEKQKFMEITKDEHGVGQSYFYHMVPEYQEREKFLGSKYNKYAVVFTHIGIVYAEWFEDSMKVHKEKIVDLRMSFAHKGMLYRAIIDHYPKTHLVRFRINNMACSFIHRVFEMEKAK